MNQFQGLNNAVFAGTLLALVAGLFRDTTPLRDRPIKLWLFVLFYLLLRLKIFWDDQKYFQKPQTRNPHFKIGLVFGVVSWAFWVAGAWTLNQLQQSYFLCGVAIAISTLWVIIVALRKGAYREQYFWIVTNTIAVVLLWWSYRRDSIPDDVLTLFLLGLAIVLVVVDFFLSKSVPEFER